MANYLVKEISVEATSKSWSSPVNIGGSSGGSTLSMTVVPLVGSEGWTPEEAKVIMLEVRKDLQSQLIVDARCRGISDPDQGEITVKNYSVAISTLREKVAV